MTTAGNVSMPRALEQLSANQALIGYMRDNRETWANFGKKNSHMYRTELFTSMSTSNLSGEAKIMVLFFFSVIKNRDRVLKAMDLLDTDMKKADWFQPVRGFIESKVVQYVTQAEKQGRFPAVNIPTCMPGFDILVWCLMVPDEDRTIENLKNRTTFSQLALNQTLQAKAKEGYANYWNNIVVGTRNPEKKEEPKMREQYYKNSENDKYRLIQLDKSNKMVEIEPNDVGVGYTEKELENYLKSFNTSTTGRST